LQIGSQDGDDFIMEFNIWWIVGGVIGLIVILAGVFFYFNNKNKGNKFLFKLHLPDGVNTKNVYAVVRRDPLHPQQKQFFFKEYNLSLAYRSPHRYENNISVRDIAFNDKQEFDYVTVSKLENGVVSKALDPQEKQMALSRIKEANNRYDYDMSRRQAMQFFGMIGLTIIMIIGLVVGTIFYARSVGDSVEVAETNREVANSLNSVANQIAQITQEQAIITNLLVENNRGDLPSDIVRPLE